MLNPSLCVVQGFFTLFMCARIYNTHTHTQNKTTFFYQICMQLYTSHSCIFVDSVISMYLQFHSNLKTIFVNVARSILSNLYNLTMQEMGPEERKKTTPRTIMIGGKAFATYTNAKRIVKLVNDVGEVVNTDPEVNSYLKVVFVPNYNVSVAELLIPGSELSQHISTAGMEASGTSNMKFSLNGCLIIGTLDGANVEIRQEIGEENFFLFGAVTEQVPKLRKEREDGLVCICVSSIVQWSKQQLFY